MNSDAERNSIIVRNKSIGEGASSTYVVGEMACAHEGRVEQAHELVDAVAVAQADAIQLQIMSMQDVISPYHPKFDVIKHFEIDQKNWSEIIAHAQQVDLSVWANVFDLTSLETAVAANVDVVKVHASDLTNPRLLDVVSKTGKPLSLGIGGATLDEISWAVKRLTQRGCEIILMYGFQAYPTRLADVHLSFIQTLKQKFHCLVGYEDHTDGGDEMAIHLPLVAMGLGACVLEKHIILDRSLKGVDYHASLDPKDFSRFVECVHEVSVSMGTSHSRVMSKAELLYRENFRKTIVAARDMKSGDIIDEDMLLFRRSMPGLSPADVSVILGGRCLKDVPQFATIHLEDIEIRKEQERS